MTLPPFRPDWEPTRATLQRYAKAITALPRAAAIPDRRWAHVSLHPVHGPTGVEALASTPVALTDGAQLASSFDVLAGVIVVSAGDDVATFVLSEGPSPLSIGTAIADLAVAHGSSFDVESDRYSDAASQTYNEDAAIAWFANTAWVVSVLDAFNEGIEGEISGPHLWPHNFDVATEWYGTRIIEESDGANSQIIVGYYPQGDPYLYSNPIPFDTKWSDTEPPHGAVWHTQGWNGVKLYASQFDGTDDRQVILDIGDFVHDLTRPELT